MTFSAILMRLQKKIIIYTVQAIKIINSTIQ